TALRDVGDEIVAESLVAKHSRNLPDTSPRVFLGSPLMDADPPYHRLIGRAVREPDEVPAFVDDMLKWGVHTFKIYVGIQRPVGKRIIEEAHRHGKSVTGHLGKYRAQDAVEDGIDSLEHISSVFDFVLPEDRPVLPPLQERSRYSPKELADLRYQVQVAEANADMAHPRVQKLIERLVQRKVAVDPTLVVFRNWMLLRDLPEVYKHPDVVAMPKRLQQTWYDSSRTGAPTPESLPLRQKIFRKQQELTGRLFRSGVSLLVGTDAPVAFCPPGFAVHQELALLVESGVTPAAALQMATLNNARTLRQDQSLGSIEAGKLADLVILDANPLAEITNSRKIQCVFRGGKVCDRQVLLKLVPAE
ncbi:MAG: amidohydrolase family protein, partial [Nitrospiraceae bacterium]